MRRIAVAVAGGSCSGKTTLANALALELDATLIKIDDYYRPLDHLSFEERCDFNFDHPDAIDSDLLVEQIQTLLNGQPVEAPRYDFSHHARFNEPKIVEPNEILIVEGLFALAYRGLTNLCDFRVFVDAPEPVCLQRRVYRDVHERGRTPEEVVARFSHHVAPMYRLHVLPTQSRANVTVSGCEDLGASILTVLRAVERVRV